jgi:hypothetical protein
MADDQQPPTGTSDAKPLQQLPPGQEAQRRRAVREARSALALRLNLQRRKSALKPEAEPDPSLP